jgi:hypothetical protein
MGDVMAPSQIAPAVRSFYVGLLVFVVMAGCGDKPDLPPTAPVSGVVMLDGRPLPRGTVQFVPDAAHGTEGPSGVGYIDEEGRYEITTAGVPGAIVGHHKISVKAEADYDQTQISMGPSLIPRRYNNPDASDLTAKVKEGEKNEIPLELLSDP